MSLLLARLSEYNDTEGNSVNLKYEGVEGMLSKALSKRNACQGKQLLEVEKIGYTSLES